MIKDKKRRAARCLEILHDLYPRTVPHLSFHNPWELLVATVLAAQCTDARVNKVTPALFKRYPNVAAFAGAELGELEGLIRSTGLFRGKARNLKAAAGKIMELYNGEMPRDMDGLLTLDGVARKTASVVLWVGFGKNEGLAVDTHVGRIARRMGLTESENPIIVEKDLCAVFPRDEWGNVNHTMVSFGREWCMARSPRCSECPMKEICPEIVPGSA